MNLLTRMLEVGRYIIKAADALTSYTGRFEWPNLLSRWTERQVIISLNLDFRVGLDESGGRRWVRQLDVCDTIHIAHWMQGSCSRVLI